MAVKIVIDAGHGGYDAGATYNGRREKDDTLALALAVGEILEAQDTMLSTHGRTMSTIRQCRKRGLEMKAVQISLYRFTGIPPRHQTSTMACRH